MKDTMKDLADRMALLHVRHGVVFGDAVGANPAYLRFAEDLEAGLRSGDPNAVARARGVVDPADLGESAFWSSSLGRLMFAAGCYGSGTVGQAFAAGVLGCSRQWVHELVARGILSRCAANTVDVEEVRAVLKTRIDELVK